MHVVVWASVVMGVSAGCDASPGLQLAADAGTGEPAPPSPERGLTAAERALLEPIFGDAVAYDEIRIVAATLPVAQRDDTYVTIGNHVFVPPPLYHDDWAAPGVDPYRQGSLVHEVVHVWQHQRGVDVIGEGLRTLAATRGVYERAYAYELDGRDLLAYGFEQQAAVIEDWFLATVHGIDAAKAPALRRTLRAFLADPGYAGSGLTR